MGSHFESMESKDIGTVEKINEGNNLSEKESAEKNKSFLDSWNKQKEGKEEQSEGKDVEKNVEQNEGSEEKQSLGDKLKDILSKWKDGSEEKKENSEKKSEKQENESKEDVKEMSNPWKLSDSDMEKVNAYNKELYDKYDSNGKLKENSDNNSEDSDANKRAPGGMTPGGNAYERRFGKIEGDDIEK